MSRISKEKLPVSCLVIEDNEGDFVLIEDYLLEKFQNVKIQHCSNCEDSISFLDNNETSVSVILLDLHLPDLEGIDLVKKVLHHAAQIPLIILTGYAEVSEAQQSLQLGVYDYLIKDEINPVILHKTIIICIKQK